MYRIIHKNHLFVYNVNHWCPKRDLNSHAEALVSKTSVSTNSTIGAYLVQPRGIEPLSMALQTTAMTTSARVAWCFVKESNFRIPLVRRAVYHLPNEAWVGPGNRTLSTCFTDRCATTTLGTTLIGAATENRTQDRRLEISSFTTKLQPQVGAGYQNRTGD